MVAEFHEWVVCDELVLGLHFGIVAECGYGAWSDGKGVTYPEKLARICGPTRAKQTCCDRTLGPLYYLDSAPPSRAFYGCHETADTSTNDQD